MCAAMLWLQPLALCVPVCSDDLSYIPAGGHLSALDGGINK